MNELMVEGPVANEAELMSVLQEIRAQTERTERVMMDLADRVDRLDELSEDLAPIMNDAGRLATQKLARWEEDGTIAFVREGLGVIETISTSFEADEVRRLGENVVSILRTVQGLTQPEVLELADRTAHALRETEGVQGRRLGLFRALRDPDVRRGMSLFMNVLREIGHEEPSHATAAR